MQYLTLNNLPMLMLTQIVKAAQSPQEKQTLPFGRLIYKIAHNYGYRQLKELPIPIKMIDENTLNNMNIGLKQRRAHIEEFRDEVEEESEDEEESEVEEEDKEEEGGEA